MAASKPVFYYDNRSPPVRSIRLLIAALQIDVTEKEIDLFTGEHMKEEYLKINPLHTVPSLKDNDIVLTDSHAILIYLCEKYADGDSKLWPKDSNDRIHVLNKLFYSASLLFRRDSDAIADIIVNKLRKEGVEEHVTKIREQYDFLEIFLNKTKYIACDYLTIADLSIVSLVSTVDMLLPVTAESWPRLRKWWDDLRQLPYYEKANGEGLLELKHLAEGRTDYPINFE